MLGLRIFLKLCLIFSFLDRDSLGVGAEFFVEPSPFEAGQHIVVSLSEPSEGTRRCRCNFEYWLIDLINEGLILFFILEMEQVLQFFKVLLDLNQIRDLLQYL
jgi:hypothetical protein